MEPTAGQVMDAVYRVQDQVTQARGEALRPEDIKVAVRDAILEAVSDPFTWEAAGKAMQEHAQKKAGSMLFGGLRVMASKVILFLLLGLAVYMTGGWSAMVTYFKSAPAP